MRSYLALIKIDLRLALRNRGVIFFNYLFPLIFFFIFAEMMNAQQGGAITFVVSMVLVIGILGNGLFGAGIRAVQEREMNILRRFKVTPITPVPLLIGSLVTGWILYMPVVFITLALAHGVYGMPFPSRIISLLVLVSVGVLAFRSIGLILASVANSSQESQLLIQLVYMPMIFLSGATIPLAILPRWSRIISQFLPATYLVSGIQAIFLRQQPLSANLPALAALLLTMVLAIFVSRQIFRWEKEEKIRATAKGWVGAVLFPFILLGGYQAYHSDRPHQQEILYRDLQRSGTLLIRDARIFVGNGKVIESGGVLIKNGKIEEVYEGTVPEAKSLRAEEVEAAGKTVLPGLIDVHVHMGAPGGIYERPGDYALHSLPRALAAYLYCGITTVRSAGDSLADLSAMRARIAAGERLGANLLLCGPLFTAERGCGSENFEWLPEFIRARIASEWVRMPKTPGEVRQQVAQLKKSGVDGIEAVLESGRDSPLCNRMDPFVFRALAEASHSAKLPLVVQTGDSHDIGEAEQAGANGIEHGSYHDLIPESLLSSLALDGTAYNPTLCLLDARLQAEQGSEELLIRSLIQQVGPAKLLEATRKSLPVGQTNVDPQRLKIAALDLERGRQNLLRAYHAGVMLVTGSDAGNFMVFHGPTVHRELQLWVQAGISTGAALEAATYNAARLLRADDRIGLLQKGHDADLLLVDGNPLKDITSTERISMVIFKGERINRSKLFDQ